MDAPWFNGEPGPEHEPQGGGKGIVYVCTVCPWRGRGGVQALEHHVNTAHDVRGRDWPASWPNAQFSYSPEHPARRT